MVTAATPKIADYHFTTLEPNLGVVKTKTGSSFVIADIPGIIEGASEGTGLGIQFLRHIERTRLLLHVIDVSGSEGRNPLKDFYTINEELKKYSEKLSTRKQIIVANKSDIMSDEELYKELEKEAKKQNIEIYKISAATKQGINELLERVEQVLKELPKENLIEIEENKVYTLENEGKGFEVEKQDKKYVVTGKTAERIIGRINIDDNESMYYFQKMMESTGINAELKRKGVREGDIVQIGELEFEWYE